MGKIIIAIKILAIIVFLGSCSDSKRTRIPPQVQNDKPPTQSGDNNTQTDTKTIPDNPGIGKLGSKEGENQDPGGPVDKTYPSSNSAKNCSGTNIKTIDNMPVDHSNLSSGVFPYNYEFIKSSSSSDNTTIVFITGGPGQDSIGIESNGPILPTKYNRLYIDPRGLGCNYQDKSVIPHQKLNSLNHAADVVRVIKALGLVRYVIYGISYGTEVSTIMGNLLTNGSSGIQKPIAIVLEGIIGNAYDYEKNTQANDLVRQWEAFNSRINNYPKELFKSSLPLDFTQEEWGMLIRMHLQFNPRNLRYIFETIKANDHNAISKLKDYLKKRIDLLNNSPGMATRGVDRVRDWVACRELTPGSDAYVYFESGQFHWTPMPIEYRSCQGFSLVNRYDSKRFQIKGIPIYYFQGDSDPLTPVIGAYYHRDNQTMASSKHFFLVPEAGHNAFATELRPCNEKLWAAIVAAGDPRTVLGSNNSCPTSYYLQKPDIPLGPIRMIR